MANEDLNPVLSRVLREQKATRSSATPQVGTEVQPIVEAADELGSEVDKTLMRVQNAMGDASVQLMQGVADIEAGVTDSQSSRSIITDSIKNISSANQTIQLAKDNAAMQAQNSTIAAFQAGGGVELQTDLMRDLGASIRKVNDLEAQKADIVDDEHTGVGVLDNIINLFRHQGVSAQLQAAKAEESNNASQIQRSTQALESVSRVNALTAETINKGTISANSRQLQEKANFDVATADLATIHSNAVSVSNLVTMKQQAVKDLIQGYRLEGEGEQRAIQREALALQKEQLTFDRDNLGIKSEKAKVDLDAAKLRLEQATTLGPVQIAQAQQNLAKSVKASEDQVVLEQKITKQVQAGQATLGGAVEDSSIILWGLAQPGKQGARYARLQEVGANKNLAIGGTPAESKNTLLLAYPSGGYTETKATRLLQTIAQMQDSLHKKTGHVIPRTQEGMDAEFNGVAYAYIEGKTLDIAAGDASNPYSAPPFSVLANTASVKNTALYQNVLKAKGMTETNPQTIIDAAMSGVLAKLVTPEEAAAGIEAIFDQAAALNSSQDGGLARIGLPSQTTYNTSLHMPTSFIDSLGADTASALRIPSPFSTALMAGNLLTGFSPDEFIKYTTVDLMNSEQIRLHLVKLRSSSPAAPTVTNP